MKITIYISLFVMLTVLTSCHTPKLSARIEFSKDTMMLGEEVQWDFVVTNVSKKPISIYYDPRGNYNNDLNRDADLSIVLKDSTNSVVKQIDSKPHDIIVRSGRVGFETLNTGEELRFPQWFNNWYKLETKGRYKISMEKSLRENKWTEICKVKAPEKEIYFYSANAADRVANIEKLEERFRSNDFKGGNERYNTLDAIIRSASETSIALYEELLNSKNSYNSYEAIRALGRLSPNPKAFLTLVRYFDMGFVNALDETINPKLKESMLENMYLSTLYQIEKFPPDMTVYFLNKVIADKKYEGSIKNKAMQIIGTH